MLCWTMRASTGSPWERGGRTAGVGEAGCGHLEDGQPAKLASWEGDTSLHLLLPSPQRDRWVEGTPRPQSGLARGAAPGGGGRGSSSWWGCLTSPLGSRLVALPRPSLSPSRPPSWTGHSWPRPQGPPRPGACCSSLPLPPTPAEMGGTRLSPQEEEPQRPPSFLRLVGDRATSAGLGLLLKPWVPPPRPARLCSQQLGPALLCPACPHPVPVPTLLGPFPAQLVAGEPGPGVGPGLSAGWPGGLGWWLPALGLDSPHMAKEMRQGRLGLQPGSELTLEEAGGAWGSPAKGRPRRTALQAGTALTHWQSHADVD